MMDIEEQADTSRLLVRLRLGSAVWSAWRADEPDAAPNLDDARLDGVILTGVIFAGVSLRRASPHATDDAAA